MVLISQPLIYLLDLFSSYFCTHLYILPSYCCHQNLLETSISRCAVKNYINEWEWEKLKICGIWSLTSYRAWRRGRTIRWPQVFEPEDEQKRSTFFQKWRLGRELTNFWTVWFLDMLKLKVMDINFLLLSFWIFLHFNLYYVILSHICDFLRRLPFLNPEDY